VRSCLYEGSVRHRRTGDVEDEFRYPLFMAYLDLSELPSCFDGTRLWSARRPALARFRRSDYLGDPDVPLSDAVRALVKERTGVNLTGPIRLLTHLRYFGRSFNPVSFYYCFDETGERVRAVVAEVTNTPWGERHAYVMEVTEPTDHGTAALMHARLAKQLHVSPLMDMDRVYDWRLSEPSERLLVHIESDRAPGESRGEHETGGCPLRENNAADGYQRSVFDATLTLERRELTPRALRGALLRYPFLTARILVRIYTRALRLRLRGARYFPHPRTTPPGSANSETARSNRGALRT
jgi:uncharacterized protein